MILMYYNPLNKIKMHEVKEKEREKKKKEEEKKKGRGEERRALLKNKATIKYWMVDGVRVTHGCLN